MIDAGTAFVVGYFAAGYIAMHVWLRRSGRA